MSYAGTYGPDETCEHDCYRKNCWRCNGSVERFAREYPDRIDHPRLAATIIPQSRVITVYMAECPSPLCSWKRSGQENLGELNEAIKKHIADCQRVAEEWSRDGEIKSAAGIRD